MIWGVTLRSPHPHARIRSIAIGGALATAGVYAVLVSDDVPGLNACGLEHADQPVLAADLVRYVGEPVALVAADHPEVARLAASKSTVDYQVLEPVTDPVAALEPGSPRVHSGGNLVRHLRIRKGDPAPQADVVVRGTYRIGMQDQAFLGPEAGLAVPDGTGGVDLFVSTQWLHVDQQQVCAALGLPPDQVRLTLAGVGGAFGGREDLSMHVHACLLALHTGKPVKMSYSREESFFGHVHRHPAVVSYEHGANRDGTLVHASGRRSTPTAGRMRRARLPSSPTPGRWVPGLTSCRTCTSTPTAFTPTTRRAERCVASATCRPRSATRRRWTSWPPRWAPTRSSSGARTRWSRAVPVPRARSLTARRRSPRCCGGSGGCRCPRPMGQTCGRRPAASATPRMVRASCADRHAVGYKNVGFSEGFDDYSTARVRLEAAGGEPVVTVHTATTEVGQGLVTIEQQICRTELGVGTVVVVPKDTNVGSAGSTSASRQTYVTGGAVKAACELVRASLLKKIADQLGREVTGLRLAGDQVWADGPDGPDGPDGRIGPVGPTAGFLGEDVLEETVQWRHRPTSPVDPETGQGFAHVQYAFAAHRAVVDVDTDLGLVKVVALDCAQDVGRAMNPQAVAGQIQGGSAQGLGLAIMEEIQVRDGMIRNPSFTDYLIPTILDVPPMLIDVLEYPDPHAPYGLRGVGEPPTISSGPAVVAAIRAATGLDLALVPVKPEDITGART